MRSSLSPEGDSGRTYIAIIPARGGSKGILNKALTPLAGRPLLDHTVLAANASSRIAETFVTTEDEWIVAQARSSGAGIIHRPARLAGDDIDMDSVLLHAIDQLGQTDAWGIAERWLVLLQPTSPLRTATDIDDAIAHLERSGGGGLVSVVEQDPEIYKSMTVNGDGCLEGMVSADAPFMRRQDCPTVVRPNGAIYIYNADAFAQAGGFYFDGVVPFAMPAERSVDIDHVEDLLAAEALLAS